MKGSGRVIGRVAPALMSMRIWKCILEGGLMDKNMGMASISISMAISMMENGSKIKKMDLGCSITKVEPATMDNGLMIKLVIMELLLMLAKMSMKVKI